LSFFGSVIHELQGISDGGTTNLGWTIGRPVLASALLAILTPIITTLALAPLYRNHIEHRFANYRHHSNLVLMTLILSAFLAISFYAGASVLFGSFLAGMVFNSLPSKLPQAPFTVPNREQSEVVAEDETPDFLHTFDKYLLDLQQYIFQPLFFSSIGFAIPFTSLWTGDVIWKGVLFSFLMLFGKLIVGLSIPCWDLLVLGAGPKITGHKDAVSEIKLDLASNWNPAMLLGTAMVARGEIGLLIIQVGFNETPYLSDKAFVIAVWAIVLNTLAGPVLVGVVLKYSGSKIAEDSRWGMQTKIPRDLRNEVAEEPGTDSSIQVISPLPV
jgi:Kef-type K+ transport system membrane component KefB